MAARFGKILIFTGAFLTPGELRVVGNEGSTLTACSSFFFGTIVDKMAGRTKEERMNGGEEGRTKERKKQKTKSSFLDGQRRSVEVGDCPVFVVGFFVSESENKKLEAHCNRGEIFCCGEAKAQKN
jgi:tryptophanyl-tRNA synthetase